MGNLCLKMFGGPPDGSGADSKEKRDIIKEVLEKHNQFRSKHNAKPLKLNKELCTIAQKHADHLAATKTFGQESDRSDRKYKDAPIGENLAKSGTTGVLDAKAEINSTMERWYKEGESYNYDNPTYQVNTGHFTQMVWQGSEELGVGWKEYKDGTWTQVIIVTNYFPAGNVMSHFEENVRPSS